MVWFGDLALYFAKVLRLTVWPLIRYITLGNSALCIIIVVHAHRSLDACVYLKQTDIVLDVQNITVVNWPTIVQDQL